MCEYKLVWSSYSRIPHSASCVNLNSVYSCMILGALIAGDVPVFYFRSCKIRFDARVRIICRCSRMPRSASCLNPKLGLGWAGLGWAGWAGLGCWVGWAGPGRAGLGWAGLGWAGLGWPGLGWAGLGWAGLG